MVKADYICSQGVLYTGLEISWNRYDEYRPRFTLFKASYTAATSTAGRALIDAAEALPDEQMRGELSETLHIELVPLGKACTHNFQELKAYIRSAFAENVWKPKFESAGQQYYTAATNEDWESVKSLNTSMKSFITANAATLAIDLETAGPNMPAAFAGDVLLDSNNFDLKYMAFLTASETGVATAAKITANNAAFNAVTKTMFDDAQVIFSNEPEIAKLFVFENIQQEIDPQTIGIKGKVLNEESNVYEEGVTVTVQKIGFPAVVINTNAHGRYLDIQEQEGDHLVTLEKPGFITIAVTERFKVGTVIRRDFVLRKAP